MARKTAKKQAEAPKVDIGAEIFASLRELEKLKGIPVDYMVERLKQALTNAYRKDREDRRDVPADNVVVDLSEHGLSMHIVKTAVEEGLGIAVITRRVVSKEIDMGRLKAIPLADPAMTRKFYLIHHKDKYFSRPLQSLVDMVDQWIGEYRLEQR